MAPYLRGTEKCMKSLPEILVGLFDLLDQREPKMVVQVTPNQRPRRRQGAYAIVEDDASLCGRRLEACQVAIALEQDLDAHQVAADRAHFPGVELALPRLTSYARIV